MTDSQKIQAAIVGFRTAADAAREAADGDSNDDEIELLQHAVACAEELVSALSFQSQSPTKENTKEATTHAHDV